jgi:hypothetical protein
LFLFIFDSAQNACPHFPILILPDCIYCKLPLNAVSHTLIYIQYMKVPH